MSISTFDYTLDKIEYKLLKERKNFMYLGMDSSFKTFPFECVMNCARNSRSNLQIITTKANVNSYRKYVQKNHQRILQKLEFSNLFRSNWWKV